MRINCVWAAGLVLAAASGRATAEVANFDRNGRLTSIVYGGDELAVRGRVQLPSPDWSRIAGAIAGRARGGPAVVPGLDRRGRRQDRTPSPDRE